MNGCDIPERQISDHNLHRLAAQRRTYADAKFWVPLQLLYSAVVPVALALAAPFGDVVRIVGAIWGVVIPVVDLIVVRHTEALQQRAAGIQEAFDCDVLQMPWSPFVPKADPEDERAAVRRYFAEHGDLRAFTTGWYPPVVCELPLHMARVVCQRSNVQWDLKLRGRVAACLFAVGAVLTAVVLTVGALRHLPIDTFLLSCVVPMTPLWLFLLRAYFDESDSMARLRQLKGELENLWQDAVQGRPEDSIAERSRYLQIRLYMHRSTSPLVTDLLYHSLQPKQEDEMNHAAQMMVAAAKASPSAASSNP